VLALVDKERDGEQVDRALVKNILGRAYTRPLFSST
jgi:hypothetical protein